ncbi:hypothetical protein, partial [Staphylococcus aureus]
AYWGTEISTAAAPESRWPQAPAFLQAYLAATAGVRGAFGSLLIVAGLLFLCWPFLSVNANSLHQLYRDRLGHAFLIKRREPATP